LCFHHFNQGEFGQGSGWLAKASRLVEGLPEECAERSYLLLPIAFQQGAVGGEYAAARSRATRAIDMNIDMSRAAGSVRRVHVTRGIRSRQIIR